jgi:hypothetical protein
MGRPCSRARCFPCRFKTVYRHGVFLLTSPPEILSFDIVTICGMVFKLLVYSFRHLSVRRSLSVATPTGGGGVLGR